MNAFPSEAHVPKEKYLPYLFVIMAYLFLAMILYFVSLSSLEHIMSTTSRLLAEQGAAIIRIFEGHVHSKAMPGRDSDLQNMFETLDEDNILFATVVDHNGIILVHGDSERVGKHLRMNGREVYQEQLAELKADDKVRWGILRISGNKVFAVYRHFYPQTQLVPPGDPPPVIILGMNLIPYKKIHSQAVQSVFVRSMAIFTVCLGGFFIIMQGMRLKESRRKREAAEIMVRRLEAEVARKEKLAAVGTLASGVAHELRNPLSSIMGYAYYFSQFFNEGSEERKYAETMSREVQRLNRVISDLLCFARPANVILKPCKVQTIVEHALRLLRQDAKRQGVEIIFNPPEAFPPAMLDADRFIQALLNVCLNALDAMPGGGKLTLALSHLNKEYFLLEVRDTGTGIAPEHISRLFEPYFTTRGHGTGLGLPTVHKIVEAHGGQITVDSGPEVNNGKGSVFCFILPFGKISEAKR